ncbi:hypothetical protein EGW08_002289 [Elysia chlorotica]|uniref:Uncharacterized protein n=1 Tax=Elysia chlorotica TaxID=188477 RepID=A0A3S1BRR0_ELYCH|nr:hypothetical protein EGW08_002289 [Elysia chlorotica]
MVCLCCSNRGHNDRRLSSYSSVKDTVQLEDLLSKPVLADPESVFSEPSFHYDRTPSVSNRSPSADSDLRPYSQVFTESEAEHFQYPNSPKKKLSSEEESHFANQTSSTQRLAREAKSVKQKTATPKGRDNSKKKKKWSSEKGPVSSQRLQKNQPKTMCQPESNPAAKDILTKDAAKSGCKDNSKEIHQDPELGNISPHKSNETLSPKHEEKQPSTNIAPSQTRELKAMEINTGGTGITKNFHQVKYEEQPKVNKEERGDPKNLIGIQNQKTHGSLEPSENKSSKETEKGDGQATLERKSTSKEQLAEKIPLKNLAPTEIPSLHTFITNPNSSRLRKARDHPKPCDLTNQQSILTPGRCSFSHEAGHTANGNSKSSSPLISRSPAHEHRLRSEGSASLSPVTSPSPADSPDIFQRMYLTPSETDLVVPTNGKDGNINKNVTSQNSTKGEYNEKIPIQIAATVERTAHTLAATNIQTNVTQITPDAGKKMKTTEEQAALRRSFSQDAAQNNMQINDVKTFSLNLQIDLHFQNAECVQTTCNKEPFTDPSSNTLEVKKRSISVPAKNVWPDLGKDNESSANNDATKIGLDNKNMILEKSFAKKTANDLIDSDFPVSRKRRSEPAMVVMSSSEYDSMPSQVRRSYRSHYKYDISKRPQRNRRSYAAGDKIGQHAGVHKATHKTVFDDTLTKSRPLSVVERKIRRFHSSESSTDTQEPIHVGRKISPAGAVLETHCTDGDKQPLQDTGIVNTPGVLDLKSKEMSVESQANTTTEGMNAISSGINLTDDNDGKIEKNVMKRRLSAPAGISSGETKNSEQDRSKTDLQFEEIAKSDPEMFEGTAASDDVLPFLKHIADQDIQETDTPDGQHGQLKHTLNTKPLPQSPGPKPKPKPRAVATSRSPVQSHSLDTKPKAPKARPRISKSVSRDNLPEVGLEVWNIPLSRKQSTEQGQKVSSTPSTIAGETKISTNRLLSLLKRALLII